MERGIAGRSNSTMTGAAAGRSNSTMTGAAAGRGSSTATGTSADSGSGADTAAGGSIKTGAGMIQEGPRRGLSGSALKWIAIITMFLDHIGASLLEVYIIDYYGNSPYHGFRRFSQEQIIACYQLDTILRCIGRIAFPIFCFLLVEGFVHTRNVKKYALRLGLFCVISELPFNLAFKGELFAPEYQNVFFTLLLGLLGIWGFSWFRERRQWVFGILSLILAAMAAELLYTDYGAFGVVFIELMYLLHNKKILRTVAGVVSLLLYGGVEMLGALAFIPISFYNGTRGKQPKYFFYIFYPLHLLLIVATAWWILPAVL